LRFLWFKSGFFASDGWEDQSGAAVPHANLEIENAATGVKLGMPANDVGKYRFNNLLASGAVQVFGMENDALVVGLDAPTANLKLGTERQRLGCSLASPFEKSLVGTMQKIR
jgi:hypothetical protein